MLLLTEDGLVDGSKTVNLVLSNPRGAILGGQSIATVTIADNDATPSATSPIDRRAVFIQQYYNDFLTGHSLLELDRYAQSDRRLPRHGQRLYQLSRIQIEIRPVDKS